MYRTYYAFLFLAVASLSAVAAPLTGEAAIQHLQATGQYDSFAAAVTGARYAARVAHGPETRARAENPAHGIRSTFTPEGLGFEVRTGETTHQVAWHLASLGYGAAQIPVPLGELKVSGQRVEIIRGDSFPIANRKLIEWFHNAPGGLEHGFTLAARPASNPGGEPLRLVLDVTGDLTPQTDAAGRKLVLCDVSGQTVLTYDHLKVWDADGTEFPAKMQVAAGQVTLAVFEAQARYPLTIDPTFTQQAYLKASNTGTNDVFGVSVAVSGDTAVVGAPGEDSNAIGINGDQSNNSATNSGAVYVFVRNGESWAQQAFLKASNTRTKDQFGTSVAVSGDTLVVGAPGEDSNAIGVNGVGSNFTTAIDSGAVYIFVRSGTNWSQQVYLKASNAQGGDGFGSSVSVSGGTVVVGAPFEDSNATGINGDQGSDPDPFFEAGAAYVFVRNGTTWTQQVYLKASNTNPLGFDEFGTSVAVSGNTVVVGAPFESSTGTGVNGTQNDLSANSAGAAYVFVRNGTTWTQQAYLKASNSEAFDWFGYSVAISGDSVVVGSPYESSNATGVNGDQNNNNADSAGAAYVFVRNGTTWTQQAYLKASNTETNDGFGTSVSVSGDTAVIGSPYEASNATGVNGNQGDNSAVDSGAAYVFGRSGSAWAQQAYLKAGNTGMSDQFGTSVAASADTVLVGAPFESSNATGVNGDGNNDNAVESGAAYVFIIPSPSQPVIPVSRLTLLGNGAFQFSFTNTNNVAFTVIATTNIVQPAVNWTVLGNATNIGSGVYRFADTNAPTFPRRFYQLRFP